MKGLALRRGSFQITPHFIIDIVFPVFLSLDLKLDCVSSSSKFVATYSVSLHSLQMRGPKPPQNSEGSRVDTLHISNLSVLLELRWSNPQIKTSSRSAHRDSKVIFHIGRLETLTFYQLSVASGFSSASWWWQWRSTPQKWVVPQGWLPFALSSRGGCLQSPHMRALWMRMESSALRMKI